MNNNIFLHKCFPICLGFSLILCSNLGFGVTFSDTLQTIIAEKRFDDEQMSYVFKRIDTIRQLDSTQTIPLLEKLAGQEIKPSHQAAIYNRMGNHYYSRQELKPALTYYTKALNINKKYDLQMGLARSYNNLGGVYGAWGDADHAVNYFRESLELLEVHASPKELASGYLNLGICYKNFTKDFAAAVHYTQKALDIFDSIQDPHQIAFTLLNMGYIHIHQDSFDLAYRALSRSLALSDSLDWERGKLNALGALGDYYTYKGDYAKALSTYQEKEPLVKSSNIAANWLNHYIDLGELFYSQQAYRQSLLYFKKAQPYAENGKLKTRLRMIYQRQSAIFDSTGVWDSAYYYQSKYIEMDQAIRNDNFNSAMARMEAELELREKEQELVLAKQENEVLAQRKELDQLQFLMVVILLILLIVGAGFGWYRLRARQQLTNMQLELAERETYQMKQDAEFRKREMMNLALYVKEKNELLQQLEDTINGFKDKSNQAEAHQKKMNDLLHKSLNVDKERQNILSLQEEMITEFEVDLGIRFPDLNPSEKRLASLILLDLSSKEIGSILGLSPNTVDVRKHRLRKKVNAGSDQDFKEMVFEGRG